MAPAALSSPWLQESDGEVEELLLVDDELQLEENLKKLGGAQLPEVEDSVVTTVTDPKAAPSVVEPNNGTAAATAAKKTELEAGANKKKASRLSKKAKLRAAKDNAILEAPLYVRVKGTKWPKVVNGGYDGKEKGISVQPFNWSRT
jgi:hypothetical protein